MGFVHAVTLINLPKSHLKGVGQNHDLNKFSSVIDKYLSGPGNLVYFKLETCQRVLWLAGLSQPVQPPAHSVHLIDPEISGVSYYQDQQAYEFILKVTTGLESELVGETDVFGQIKSAWDFFLNKQGKRTNGDLSRLNLWMQKIFEDTKAIRSEYLQHCGEASYGSLVRKLLKQIQAQRFVRSNSDEVAENPKNLVLVGAGQLAQSVGPWLKDFRVHLMNRNKEQLVDFSISLRKKGIQDIHLLMNSREEEEAWENSQFGVICIPSGSELDMKCLQWWQKGSPSSRSSILHLGATQNQLGAWAEAARKFSGVYTLDKVIAMQEQQNHYLKKQVILASKACEEKAILRYLPGSPNASIGFAHGWEDLACFR